MIGQNSYYFTGGISDSHIPIFTQKANATILSTSFRNALTFSVGYNHRVNKNLIYSGSLNYRSLGANTLYRQVDENFFFVNTVNLEYLSFKFVPKGELSIGKYSMAVGLGASISFLANHQIENYLLNENGLEFLYKEDIELKRFDLGGLINLELKRRIGSRLYLIMSLEQYQGFIGILHSGTNKVYISNTALNIGVQFPINKKKA